MFPDFSAPAAALVSIVFPAFAHGIGDTLSAREESASFGHLVAVFAVGADAEGNGGNTENGSTHDCGVGFPVRGLSVPTTGW